MQDGCTALWLACYNKHQAAAAELIEATKRDGALDRQVAHEAWLEACVVRDAVKERERGRARNVGARETEGQQGGGEGRGGKGGERGVRGAQDTDVGLGVPLSTG